MAKQYYYSIRVVEADSYDEAIEKVEGGDFSDDHELCDSVLSTPEIIAHFDQFNSQ